MAPKTQKSVVQLIIEGKGTAVSLKEVGSSVQKLTKEFKDLKEADDPKLYAEKLAELKKVREEYNRQKEVVGSLKTELKLYNAQQKDITKAVNSSTGVFSSLTGGMTAAVFAGNLLSNAFNSIVGSIPSLISKAGKLSDELADVQKQTGISGKELQTLNTQLGNLRTRTPVEELRALAAVAGKLGYTSKEEVLGFVRAADMINVALGEDLGGNIEETINDIGKITKIFGLEQDFGIEKSMLMVASAINTVGASSEANEGFMVEWTKRFAGIAPNAKISIADTLGLAAAMDITGQSSELSATNIGKMVIAMGKDVPYFAKVAGMSIKDFSKLLQTDGNEAFLRVLEGAKNTTKGVEGLAKTLDAMGIQGTEGAQILGVLTNNIELVRSQQALANAELQKGTSVIDEFNVKNKNAGAIIEIVWKQLVSSKIDSLTYSLSNLIVSFGEFIGIVSSSESAIGKLVEQQQKVRGLESIVTPLINRYEELKSKTNLSKAEQDELQKVIVKLGEVLPNSVTKFDQYGNAIDISTDKARQALQVQKQLLKVLNADAIKAVDKDIRRAELSMKNMRTLMDDKSGVEVYRGHQGYVRVPRSEERTAEIVQNYKDANAELQALLKRRKELQGEFDIKPTEKTTPTAVNAPTNLSKSDYDKEQKKQDRLDSKAQTKAERAAEKALQDRKKLTEDISKEQQDTTLNQLSAYEKEIVGTALHYDEMRERAKGNADDIEKINELQKLKIQEINDKFDKKLLSDKETFIKQINDLVLNAEGNEIAKINAEYDQKIADAERFGISTVAIEKARLDAIDKVRNASDEKDRQKALENFRFKVDQAEAEGNTVIPIIRSRLEEIDQLITKSTDKESKAYHELVKEKNELLKEERNISREQVATILKTFEASSEALSNILTLVASDQSEFAEFQRALAIFQIAIETSLAVANAISSSTKGDSYTMALRIATAIATVTAGFVKVKSLMNEAKQPKTPTFADGGFTDRADITPQTTGFIDRATLYSAPNRRFIAGEAGREFIMGNQILQHPAVAAYANMIDSIQKTRNFGALDQISAATASSNSNNAELIAEFRAMRAEFKAYQQFELKRPVDFSFEKFNRKNDFWLNVKKDASA